LIFSTNLGPQASTPALRGVNPRDPQIEIPQRAGLGTWERLTPTMPPPECVLKICVDTYFDRVCDPKQQNIRASRAKGPLFVLRFGYALFYYFVVCH